MSTSDISSTKTTLLNYLSKYVSNYSTDSTSSDDIASLLQQSSTASNAVVNKIHSQATKASAYSSTLSNTQSLLKYLGKLSDTSSTSLFTNAETSKDTSSVVKNVENFVSGYNSLLSSLSKEDSDGESSTDLLVTNMKKYADNLSGVGIAVSSDGKLAVDETKLKSADVSDLKALFGEGTDFSDSMSAITSKIQNDTSDTCELLAIYNASYSNSGSYSQYDYVKNLFDTLG